MDAEWVGKVADAATQQLSYHGYNDTVFKTSIATVDAFIKHPHRAEGIELLANQPCFDTVIIDSPLGGKKKSTGRAVPIYTAAIDSRRCIKEHSHDLKGNVTVFVHDATRRAEHKLTHAFLGEPTYLLKQLREFRLS